MAIKALETLAPVTNGAKPQIDLEQPYRVEAVITGTTPLLFHAWNNEAVAGKAKAAKGSIDKKSDNLESYVYRLPSGEIGIPAEYMRGAIVNAARYSQDPRSPRKSAMDLMKAALALSPELASLGKADWDYLDARRVMVQRNGITRVRPAFMPGWSCAFLIDVLLPEYVSPDFLAALVERSGKLVGVGDFRPTYGRFRVARFDVIENL